MPFNITTPNTADFGVTFVDNLTGIVYTPSSASLTIIYQVSGTATTFSTDFVFQDGRWEASWSSVGVDVPSDATWTIISSCSPSPAQIGTIRIIDP